MLDTVRWVSALLVVMYHGRSALFESYGKLDSHSVFVTAFYAVTSLGHQAVIVFFVLSGFLVGGSAWESFATGRFDWRHYAVNRFSRLYAVLPVALLAGGGLDLIRLESWGVQADAPGAWRYETLSLSVFVGNLANLQKIVVPEFGSNTALWSLANEFWYYVLFPLVLCAAHSRHGFRARFIAGVAAVAVLGFVGKWISVYFVLWLLGALAARHHQKMRLPAWIPAAGVFLALGVGIGVTRYLTQTTSTDETVWRVVFPSDLLLSVSFAAYLAANCNRADASDWLWTRLATTSRHLAAFSYSLYLLHWPMLALLHGVLRHSDRLPLRPDPAGLLLFSGVVLALVAYAFLLSHLTEHRTPQFRAKLIAILGLRKSSAAT